MNPEIRHTRSTSPSIFDRSQKEKSNGGEIDLLSMIKSLGDDESTYSDRVEDNSNGVMTTTYASARGGDLIEINPLTLVACPQLQQKVGHRRTHDEISLKKYSCDVIRVFLTFVEGGEVDCGRMTEGDMCELIELGCEYLEEETETDRDTQTLTNQVVTEDNVVAVYMSAYSHKFRKAASACKRFVQREMVLTRPGIV